MVNILDVWRLLAIHLKMLTDISCNISFWISGLKYLSALFNQVLSSGLSNCQSLKSCMKLLYASSCPRKASTCLPKYFTFWRIFKKTFPVFQSALCISSGQGFTDITYSPRQHNHHLDCFLMAFTLLMSTKCFCGIFPVGESLLYERKDLSSWPLASLLLPSHTRGSRQRPTIHHNESIPFYKPNGLKCSLHHVFFSKRPFSKVQFLGWWSVSGKYLAIPLCLQLCHDCMYRCYVLGIRVQVHTCACAHCYINEYLFSSSKKWSSQSWTSWTSSYAYAQDGQLEQGQLMSY